MYYIVIHFRRILTLLILAAASTGCYWSLRLAWADWMAGQETVAATEKSTELAPWNSAYLRHAAEIREVEGLPGNGLEQRAALVNPLDSQNLIHLAGTAEMQGRLAESEAQLLRAYAADRQFEPRLALANFYFRAGNGRGSLEWSRRALEFGRGDMTSVFQLCWAASGNAKAILEHCVPHNATSLAQYLRFLDVEARFKEARDVADLLIPLASAEQVSQLLAHCTKTLEAGRGRDAMAVWNELKQRGLNTGAPVTGQAFDWRVEPVDGVRVERLRDRGEVRVAFSEIAPEHSVILKRWAVFSSARKYHFRATYRTARMSGAGLSWVVRQPQTGITLVTAALPEDVSESRSIEKRFESPAGVEVAQLELRYDRAPGTVRPQGSIQFSRLTLEPEQ